MNQRAFAIDLASVRRSFDRAAEHYDESAVLQAAVRQELLARLDYVALQPAVILDIGCGTGHATQALQRRFPQARVIALDLSEGMLRVAAGRASAAARICADAMRLPFRSACADLVFSSLTLQWCDALDAVFGEFRRVLRPRGLLNFSTFGPQTLHELRSAWAQADGFVHVSEFADMQQLGDGLLHAGLAEAVLDQERYTLTYEEVSGLMHDLRSIGAHNAASNRARGMTGRGRLRAMASAYEQFRHNGRLPATYEVIFGQAWGPAGSVERGRRRGEFVVAADTLRQRDVPA